MMASGSTLFANSAIFVSVLKELKVICPYVKKIVKKC